ncbi:alpha/beta hydrolase-fold protein [Catalinimonas alkaloidigena]|uniref:alpha/beta hydrolase-fold protein n=1 Tax=Catalinimonas alkaloidigena TaxID=1075417 RepID=UPI002404E328|nr:alpha/beta hydrolase-fold protein [Catalinimonas alkaloidigena]
MLVICIFFCSIELYANDAIIIDAQHYSHVMGEMRNYRVILPPGYYENTDKKYPVVYFYHGWSQRYFGSLVRNEEDHSKPKIDDELSALVAKHSIIIVKPDGYNADPDNSYYLRPYNIGPVETHRQFPLYFPELVNYINGHYKTIADRNHRAISGFSMGGFMSFWIAGKYPHLLSAAGSFCGSSEFVVGPKDFPVEYHHKDMYKNYEGLKLRLHFGKDDFIRAYHRDIDRIWLQLMDNYDSQVYEGGHAVSGLADMFSFYADVFKSPPKVPQQWHHTDVYPEFSVWGYEVSSDRNVPGFTVLENVDKNGFQLSVRKFLPQGETLPSVKLSVLTAPLYKKNTEYIINVVNLFTQQKSQQKIRSDDSGRLKIKLNGGFQEVGISESVGSPNISIASVKVENPDWATANDDMSVLIELVNKGSGDAEDVTAKLLPYRNTARIKKDVSHIENIGVNEVTSLTSPFVFRTTSDSSGILKFKLLLTDQKNHQWQESFTVDIKPESAPTGNFEIADGREITFVQGGKDTVTSVLGVGNGDGEVNPGESIAILVKDEGILWPASLYSSDPDVDLSGSHTRVSDSWTEFDHVGGSFKYSVPTISSDCSGKTIHLLAEYWIPDYPDHHIRNNKISILVSGKDQTPPKMAWAEIGDDNIIQVRLYDGGNISQASATFQLEDEPETKFLLDLNDEGIDGDSVAGDKVFSRQIKAPKFGLYQISVTASDFLDNTTTIQIPEPSTLYGAKLYYK